ncbi:MAG: uridine phosphorylase [Candidatus Aminicenantia bacterium]
MKVYHLALEEEKLEGARYALLPGDPFRCESIAEYISKRFNTFSRKLAWNREFCSYLTAIEEERIVVTSTGIGGPSTSIAVEELSKLGIKTFIRIGTTGAIQPYIEIGDVIITSASVRLDGASTHYAPIEYPASAHYQIIEALVKGALSLGFKEGSKRIKKEKAFHVGITVSSDTFYPGQERYDSFSKYVIKRLQGTKKEWEKLNCLNYEMESSALLTICNVFGFRGACVTGVINLREEGEEIKNEVLKIGVENAISVAVEGLKILIEYDRNSN